MSSLISYRPQVWLGSQVSSKFLPSTIRPLAGHVKLTENGHAKCIGCNYWKNQWKSMNRFSAVELGILADAARDLGAGIDVNILSRSLFFLKAADLDSMWPERKDVAEIAKFVRDRAKRPEYEVDYITRYYNHEKVAEPACVLGYLQVFVLSNGDVLTGCYPLKPFGNVPKDSLVNILASEAHAEQSKARIRRKCPGCTCGIESFLAMKHSTSSAFYELCSLMNHEKNSGSKVPIGAMKPENAAQPQTIE
jgi:iron-sulfur cluster protein